jgi:sugar phosphate isomerase/epimerase
MFSRREFASLPLAALPAAAFAKPASRVQGVTIGLQSYSFRDRSLDALLAAMGETGLSSCELWQGHIEPQGLSRQEIAKWRETVDLKEFEAVRKKFDAAGVELNAYNYSFREDFSEAEVARGFEMAKALGIRKLTASSNVTTARRIDRYAKKEKIWVGMHNHSRIAPNEFATPQNFADAMRGMSEFIGVNLDIGHFVAAGFDPVEYLAKNHRRIVTLHIKDRKKNQGENVPFGQGDTPIKEVLRVLRDKRLSIPANIEYEYKGADAVAEVRKCYEYCRAALA